MEQQLQQQIFTSHLEDYKIQRTEMQKRQEMMDKIFNYIILLLIGLVTFVSQLTKATANTTIQDAKEKIITQTTESNVFFKTESNVLIAYSLVLATLFIYLLSRAYLIHNSVLNLKGKYIVQVLLPNIRKTTMNKNILMYDEYIIDNLLPSDKDRGVETYRKVTKTKKVNRVLTIYWVVIIPILLLLFLATYIKFNISNLLETYYTIGIVLFFVIDIVAIVDLFIFANDVRKNLYNYKDDLPSES